MQTSAPLILFVCSANVCRSPLAVAVFGRSAPDLETGGLVRVASAGVDVRPGDPRCEWSAAKAGDVSGAGARALDSSVLNEAAVVLAADRSVVSAMIRRFPSARERVFTMKEAAELGRIAVGNPVYPVSSLHRLVGEMDAHRGWLPIDEPATRRFRQRRTRQWSRTLDVPDAHSDGVQVRHDVMFTELDAAVIRFAAVVSTVCSTLPSADSQI